MWPRITLAMEKCKSSTPTLKLFYVHLCRCCEWDAFPKPFLSALRYMHSSRLSHSSMKMWTILVRILEQRWSYLAPDIADRLLSSALRVLDASKGESCWACLAEIDGLFEWFPAVMMRHSMRQWFARGAASETWWQNTVHLARKSSSAPVRAYCIRIVMCALHYRDMADAFVGPGVSGAALHHS